jgi:transposase-like protein
LALNRYRLTWECKLQVLREVEAGKPLAQATREHRLHPTLTHRWPKEHRQYAQRGKPEKPGVTPQPTSEQTLLVNPAFIYT